MTKRRAGLWPANVTEIITLTLCVIVSIFVVTILSIQKPAPQSTMCQAEPTLYRVDASTFEELYETTSYDKACQVPKIAVASEQITPPPKFEQLKSEYAVAGTVYEYLNEHGLSDPVIAGILGNMMTECGGQTLDLQWDIYSLDGSDYYGLCQWSLYYNPSVEGMDVTGQLDYLMSNIQTNMEYFGGSFDAFCEITDAESAARYFCNYYERGTGESLRATNASTAFEWIKGE